MSSPALLLCIRNTLARFGAQNALRARRPAYALFNYLLDCISAARGNFLLTCQDVSRLLEPINFFINCSDHFFICHVYELNP